MDEIFVITAERYNGYRVFAGYENSSRAMPVWYEEEEERFAQEFSTVEMAKSWYKGAEKHLKEFLDDYCFPYSVCIQKKIIRCSYQDIEKI